MYINGLDIGSGLGLAKEIQTLRALVTAIHNKLECGDVYQWDDGDPVWGEMRRVAGYPADG